MKFEADFHNFGQSVQKIGRGSEMIFQKPRPIYWEWLFFGKNSPLSFFFDYTTFSASPGQTIFNLEIEMGADFKGFSREIHASTNPCTREHLYSLGVLLGYCYVFGIRDLHRNNVVRTTTHLQAIDAEVVLSRLLLPHETLLLPFKEVGPDLCGASSVLDLAAVSAEQIETVLRGYYDVFQCISSNLTELQRTFEEQRSRLERIPVRHILRDTIHYRSARANPPEIPLFESEVEQLGRGDIPYFFKFVGEPHVHAYTDRADNFSRVSLPSIFEKGAARDASLISELLNAKRIETLMPTGFLYLVKALSRAIECSVTNAHFAFTLRGDEVSASIAGKSFTSARS
jgi:lantibiotic modifying enzyme